MLLRGLFAGEFFVARSLRPTVRRSHPALRHAVRRLAVARRTSRFAGPCQRGGSSLRRKALALRRCRRASSPLQDH